MAALEITKTLNEPNQPKPERNSIELHCCLRAYILLDGLHWNCSVAANQDFFGFHGNLMIFTFRLENWKQGQLSEKVMSIYFNYSITNYFVHPGVDRVCWGTLQGDTKNNLTCTDLLLELSTTSCDMLSLWNCCQGAIEQQSSLVGPKHNFIQQRFLLKLWARLICIISCWRDISSLFSNNWVAKLLICHTLGTDIRSNQTNRRRHSDQSSIANNHSDEYCLCIWSRIIYIYEYSAWIHW